MTPSTDDIRIREIKALITPRRVIGEFPQTQASSATVANSRTALSDILHHADDRLLSWSARARSTIRRRRWNMRTPACREEPSVGRARDRDARLLREAAHHGRLEGADQRSRPRRQLPHQRGPAHRARAAARHQPTRPAGRLRVPRHRSRRSTSPTWSPGARSARAPPRARCTASWPRACPARSASRTAPTATSGSPSTRCRRRAQPHHFLAVHQERPGRRSSRPRGNDDCHVILRGGKAPNYDAAQRRSGLPRAGGRRAAAAR